MNNKMYRQGDLLIQEVDSLPKDIKKRENRIILWGEATGHKHQLTTGSVFDGKDGAIYLELLKGGKIVHDEHNPISLKKGKYAVIRQREYLMKDMTRLVVD